MTTDAILEVRDVRKHFGGITALDGVSMTVEAGRVFGLVGPNGSGKTTLFNIITGFERPDTGRIIFDAKDITGNRPDRIACRGLVRTFQSAQNPARMTVMENMLLAPQHQAGESVIRGLLRPSIVRRQEAANKARAREILALVKLDHQVDTLAGELSGGQKKLLMLGQTLMMAPKLILLDEPVAGVHPDLINDITDTIRHLQSEGQNFLIIEHNMSVIRALCDTICVLDASVVLACGETEETLQRDDVLDAYLGRAPAPAQAPEAVEGDVA